MNQETSGEGSKLRELNAALEHWRPHIVDALLELGASARAFELAERYRDFASLVRLCYDAGGVDARHDDLVRFYMGKYGRDFVFPLYTSFVHKGAALRGPGGAALLLFAHAWRRCLQACCETCWTKTTPTARS